MEKMLVQQVLSMSPEQINMLPPEQRQQVLQLRDMLRSWCTLRAAGRVEESQFDRGIQISRVLHAQLMMLPWPILAIVQLIDISASLPLA
jgi:hypothetical protein